MAEFKFDITKCARPNILKLQPYRCARDDYKDDGTNVLLDANENAFGPGLDMKAASAAAGGLHLEPLKLHRYPDPHQHELKQLICNLRNTNDHTTEQLTPENLFVGVGSDEAIDALLRCFCAPGVDKILTCPPTYGMYAVSAQVNDLAIVTVPLTADTLELDTPAILTAIRADPTIKLMYLCSPGNPTGKVLSKAAITTLLAEPWNGIIVVDEAYIDFAPAGSSLAQWTTAHPNLVVMQTLSKAFGLAALRLGAAFASPPIATLLNSLKAPYNISTLTSALACAALQPAALALTHQHAAEIAHQRARLAAQLPRIRGIGSLRGGLNANFLLVQVLNGADGVPDNGVALAVYERLAERRGVVVRFRGREQWCEGCLRITVGTAEEVDRFLVEIEAVLGEILGEQEVAPVEDDAAVVAKEADASRVVN